MDVGDITVKMRESIHDNQHFSQLFGPVVAPEV